MQRQFLAYFVEAGDTKVFALQQIVAGPAHQFADRVESQTNHTLAGPHRQVQVGNGPVDPVESPNYHTSGQYAAYYSPYPLSERDFLVSANRGGKFVLYLMDELGMDVRAVEAMLYKESGLLGVSGVSSDMRTLLASDEPRAKFAVELFCYRLGRELGSMAAALGGLDALVFTGGIGEHAAPIRARVVEAARWLGLTLDPAANAAHGPRISAPGAARAWVVPTNEELMIARHTQVLLGTA